MSVNYFIKACLLGYLTSLSFCCSCPAAFAWSGFPIQISSTRPRTTWRDSISSTTSLFSASNDEMHDDPVLRLPLMEAELATEKDKERKMELKERVYHAKTSAEFGVRRAQVQFYEAFSNQDVDEMKNIWSTADDVRCVHPGMTSLNGPEAVLASWQQIFSSSASFTIEPSRTRIDVCGQTALCSCVEETPGGGKLECLNVYRREDGSWKMILHMASPIVMMQ